jgi:hypothetical protein
MGARRKAEKSVKANCAGGMMNESNPLFSSIHHSALILPHLFQLRQRLPLFYPL